MEIWSDTILEIPDIRCTCHAKNEGEGWMTHDLKSGPIILMNPKYSAIDRPHDRREGPPSGTKLSLMSRRIDVEVGFTCGGIVGQALNSAGLPGSVSGGRCPR